MWWNGQIDHTQAKLWYKRIKLLRAGQQNESFDRWKWYKNREAEFYWNVSIGFFWYQLNNSSNRLYQRFTIIGL